MDGPRRLTVIVFNGNEVRMHDGWKTPEEAYEHYILALNEECMKVGDQYNFYLVEMFSDIGETEKSFGFIYQGPEEEWKQV